MNHVYETIRGRTFQGVINKGMLMGTEFKDCAFKPGTIFVKSNLKSAAFINCSGVDNIELGRQCRADGAVIDGLPWTPKKFHATCRVGKPVDQAKSMEILEIKKGPLEEQIADLEKDGEPIPAPLIEELARLVAEESIRKDTIANRDGAYGIEAVDRGVIGVA